ncbi:hypothetical protein RhiirC2_791023 [Rhizophagus irregularis]|uniref:Uncharacterized protein n=1 Tax=Rhizophagus irregularis TaxID=588596 RepID=A0A2N1MK25_9GLOM|nr:hypothetical protein RhiirC2_791023 [Rhizophagus irregularis]
MASKSVNSINTRKISSDHDKVLTNNKIKPIIQLRNFFKFMNSWIYSEFFKKTSTQRLTTSSKIISKNNCYVIIESLWIGQFVNLLHDSITSEISDISRNILDDSDENNVKGDEINDSGNNKRAGEDKYDYNIYDILSMDNGNNNDTSLLFNALYM